MSMTGKDFEDQFPGLQVYGQDLWHDDASICGTREGIKRLRDALTQALDNPNGVALCEGVFCNDGEGYSVPIYCLPYTEFDALAVPYTGDAAAAPDESLWPSMLAVQPRAGDAA